MTQQDFKLSIEAIKKKIAALMAKTANEDGTLPEGVTKEEAAAFSAAAIRLATKFNLDLAEAANWKPGTYERFEIKLGRQRWRRDLIVTLGSYAFCKLFYMASTGTTIIIGEPHNRELVVLMYSTLVSHIEPEAKKAHRLYGGDVHARHWKDQFYAGFQHAISVRLRQQKQEETQTREVNDEVIETNTAPVNAETNQLRALMIVKDHELNKAIENLVGQTRGSVRAKKYRWDTNAWSYGYEAGKAAPLTDRKQIGATK